MSTVELVKEDEGEDAITQAKQLPEMSGYHVLIAPIEPEKKTAGGIWKPDQLVDLEQSAAVCGLVLKMGPDCFSDKDRFKEPWCAVGDVVLLGAYKGTRFKIHGQEFRVVNDDQVLGTIDDPRGFGRT